MILLENTQLSDVYAGQVPRAVRFGGITRDAFRPRPKGGRWYAPGPAPPVPEGWEWLRERWVETSSRKD